MSSVTSTTSNFSVDPFENVSYYVSTYVFIFYLIFGNIGNIFKIFFFLQKPLKRCPCTIYVLFATISHFFTLNNVPLWNLLSKDWMIINFGTSSSTTNEMNIESVFSSSANSITLCQIRNYFHMWSSNFSFQVLVFASINRFSMVIKKKNRSQKQRLSDFFSSLSAAYLICSTTCFIWALISLHHYFNITMKDNICSSQNSLVWAIGLVVINIVQTILMVVLGTLTIFYRQERVIWFRRRCRNDHEITPMFNQLCQYCRHERSEQHHVETELTSMIITEIILVILTILPYRTYTIYRLIAERNYGKYMEFPDENFIERLIQLTVFFEPSCGFYIYLFSLTTLKKRFINIMRQRLGMI